MIAPIALLCASDVMFVQRTINLDAYHDSPLRRAKQHRIFLPTPGYRHCERHEYFYARECSYNTWFQSDTFKKGIMFMRVLGVLLGYPPEVGGAYLVWVGTTDKLGVADSGAFLVPWMRKDVEIAATRDREQQDGLWEWLEERRLKFLAAH